MITSSTLNSVQAKSIIKVKVNSTFIFCACFSKDFMFVWLSLIINQYGRPIFMNTHSGNASDKSIILESTKSLKSNGSYITEDVFTFLAKEGLRSARRVSAMAGFMNTSLGILSINVSGDHNIHSLKDDHTSVVKSVMGNY